MVHKTQNGRELNFTGKAAGRYDSLFQITHHVLNYCKGKNVLPISKIDVHFYFYAAEKTFNRKINQMVIEREVGSLLRPFSYCQVSCQKTFPSKQINTSLAIDRFALR